MAAGPGLIILRMSSEAGDQAASPSPEPAQKVIQLDLPGTWPNGAKITITGEEATIHVLGVDNVTDLVAIFKAARLNGATRGTLYTGKVTDATELARYLDLVKRGQTRIGGKVIQLGPDTFRIDFDVLPTY